MRRRWCPPGRAAGRRAMPPRPREMPRAAFVSFLCPLLAGIHRGGRVITERGQGRDAAAACLWTAVGRSPPDPLRVSKSPASAGPRARARPTRGPARRLAAQPGPLECDSAPATSEGKQAWRLGHTATARRAATGRARSLRGAEARRRLGHNSAADRRPGSAWPTRWPRPRQPARWERLGNRGRARWRLQAARLAAGPPGRDRRHDAGRDGQGPRRFREARPSTSPTSSTSTAKRAEKVIGDEKVPASPLMKTKKLRVQYRRPYPVVGVHQPLELPPDPLAGRRASRAAGRRRRGDQALGGVTRSEIGEIVQAWKRDISGRTCSTSSTAEARRAPPLWTRSTSCSSRALTAPPRRCWRRQAAETLTPVTAELGARTR